MSEHKQLVTLYDRTSRGYLDPLEQNSEVKVTKKADPVKLKKYRELSKRLKCSKRGMNRCKRLFTSFN